MEFAIRSWNNKRGSLEGPIQFFKKGSDKPIKWERGVKLPFNKVEFSYEGNRHSFKKLISPVYKETYFKEIFDKQKALNNLNVKMIENPFNKREKISVRDLNRKIQSSKKGYGYSANRGALDLFHGKYGVGDRPFTDLTYGASDINKMEEVFRKSTVSKDPTIAKSEFNKIRKVLLKSTVNPKTGKKLTGDTLNQSIIDRSNYQAEAMRNNKFKGYEDLKKMVMEEAKNPNSAVCRSLGRFRKDGGRIGFASGSGCIIQATNALDENPIKFAQDMNKTEGVLPKIQNAATRFLQGFKTSGSLRGKVALGAGAVIGGGGAAALVRQFRSDDKSTYLTNDRQMEGMIIADDIERDLDDMGFILDNEGKIELAATGALSASMVKKVYNAARAGEAQLLEMPTELDQEARALRKTIKQILYKNGRKVKRITESGQQVIRESRDRLSQIENLAKDTKLRGTTGDLVNPGRSGRIMSALGLRKGVLGLGLNAFMSPAIALPTAAMSVARDIKSGKSTEDTLTNPFTYLPTAFMKSGMKGLAKMGATRGLMGVAGLGLGSVAAAPVVGALSIAGGLATLGSMGYQGYKMFKDRNKTDEDFFN